MNYVDVAIIAIMVLFALIGLWKGVAKTAIKLVCFVASVVVAYFIGGYLLDKALTVGFVKKLVVGDGFSLYKLYYGGLSSELAAATTAPEVSGIFGLFVAPMIERFTAMGGPSVYGITYGQFVAISLSVNTLTLLITLVVYGVVRLLAHILAKILKKIFVHGKPKAVGRIVGFVVGAVRGAAIVAVLMIISTVIFPMKFGFAKAYVGTFDESLIGKKTAVYVYDAYDKLVYGSDEESSEEFMKKLGYEKTDDASDSGAESETTPETSSEPDVAPLTVGSRTALLLQ